MYFDEESILEEAAGGLILTDKFHEKQKRIFNDPSKFRVVIGGRRSGKTTEFASEALDIADQFPDPKVSVPYIALTVTKAMDVMLPMLHEIANERGIELDVRMGDAKVYTPNGGCIQMGGLATTHDVEKGRSGSYPLLIVDESGAQRQRLLKRAITETYGPAVKDWYGKGGKGFLLGGTPDYAPKSYWHDLCGGNEHVSKFPGVSVHHMTIHDNPFYAGRELEVIQTYCNENAISIDDPRVQREWYGRFCYDSHGLAFPSWSGNLLPFERHPRMGYTVLGLDLGSVDPCAWVVVRFTEEERLEGPPDNRVLRTRMVGHVLESYSESELAIHEVVDITKHFMSAYDVQLAVGDSGGGGKLTIDSMRRTFGVPIEPVVKSGHVQDRIWFADGMFRADTLRVYDRCESLADELSGTPKEIQSNGLVGFMNGYPDHNLDALLYAMVAAKQYDVLAPLPAPITSREHADAEIMRAYERAVANKQRQDSIRWKRRLKSRK